MARTQLTQHWRMRKGFTLIEMSVVLTIIGLLIAGIAVAKSLVRTTKVQTIISDVATYRSAIAQFRQKYSAIPGDMANAQSYWGINPNCAAGGTGTGTQTCNGNGDGQITLDTTANYEQFLAWQHLANGGFIQGQYTGTSATGATTHNEYCSVTVNCPGGSLSPAQSYFIQYSAGALGSTTNYWAQAPGHYLIVGTSEYKPGGYPAFPLVSAPEAQSLDSKVDDGLPGQGLWKSFEATGGAGFLPNCVISSSTGVAPTDGTLTSEPGAIYNVKYGSGFACSFEINLGF